MRRTRYQLDAPRAGQDRWLVSYADLVTLLFAFFVVMYSISQANDGDYRVLSNSISNAFARVKPSVLQTGEASRPVPKLGHREPTASPPAQVPFRPLDAEPGRTLAHVAEAFERNREQRGIDRNEMRVSNNAGGLRIELNATLLFPNGSAVLLTGAAPVLRDLAGLLGPLGHAVRVEGYTDNVPIRNERFASNWELSAARAASIVRVFEEHGVAPGRLSILAFGAQRPVVANDSAAGRSRNRRVVINLLAPKPDGEIPGPLQTWPVLPQAGSEVARLDY